MDVLPVKLDDLITGAVESVRIEYKGGWSQHTLSQTVRTICAFANDYLNLNGGYVVIGIEESGGAPILPPAGLDPGLVDEAQKQITGQCRRIAPQYQPLVYPVTYQGKQLLVIWAPAGDNRPYQAPESVQAPQRAYYVRLGSQTVEARDERLTDLMQMTAKTPFDDRRNLQASIDAISPTLVRNFLSDIGSDLVSPGSVIPDRDLILNLRLSVRINAHEAPRNVALLFFASDPEQFFPGARIEVVQFGDDAGGNLIEEKVFRGPLHHQLRQALDYLNAYSSTMVHKVPNRAEAQRTVAFPYEAMREALVNAVYHRSYDGVPEPTKVYLYPNRMEIISYPGPVPGVELKHFLPGGAVPPVPNRNRRIGELLKDLRLAEARGTGIPKIRRRMAENGSPSPVFEFDEASRSYFRVILPAHPQYVVIHALRESSQLWAVGERQNAVARLDTALDTVKSGALLAQKIDYLSALGDRAAAEQVFAEYERDMTLSDRHLLYAAAARMQIEHGNEARASEILDQAPAMPGPEAVDDIVDWAILFKRASRLQQAHQIFDRSYDRIKDSPRALQEFAQTLTRLASQTRHQASRKQLNRQAEELLRRAIQLSTDNARSAWCWFDLARVLPWLRAPDTEINQAYERAIALLPDEPRFKEGLQNWLATRHHAPGRPG
jgi:ATP-dependent DNA helicase RecG